MPSEGDGGDRIRSPLVLGDLPDVAAEHRGAGAIPAVPKLSPEHGEQRVTAGSRKERCTKAALILPGEDMRADSYLGTLRYQNP